MKNFILLGPPGCGKGTQSKHLIKKFNFSHISSGDIIRNNIIKKTPLSILLKYYYNKGKLIPNYIVIKIIKDFLKTKINNDLIWDGFPRTIVQAKKLDKFLKKINSKINQVIYFKINKKKIISRIIDRLVCLICNNIYHKIISPPKIKWFCDNDKTKLVQRKDDNEKKIKIRLAEYYIDTTPLIKFYLNKKILTTIDANMEEYEILSKIIEILK